MRWLSSTAWFSHRYPRGETGLLRLAWGTLAIAGCCSLSGCFDGEALVAQSRRQELLLQLEEVDLGTYSIALPQMPGESRGGLISFHAFGQVANKNREAVDRLVEVDSPKLRHQMLLAIRSLPIEALAEPDLKSLRSRVAEVVNGTFTEAIVQKIGFYEFSFSVL